MLEGPRGVLTLGWRVPRSGWATVEEEMRVARSPLGARPRLFSASQSGL